MVSELVRIGFSDIRKLVDRQGRLVPLHELDDNTVAALASVEVITRSAVDDGGQPVIECVHKYKFWDKNSALEKLGKHLGMYLDRKELTGKDGGPIEFQSILDEIDGADTGIGPSRSRRKAEP